MINSFFLSIIGASGAKIGLMIGAVSVPVGRHLFTPMVPAGASGALSS